MRIKCGSEWRCGRCGKIYSTLELLGLERVKLVESDTDPYYQHGFTSVCTCGYRFHLDKWRLHDRLKIKIDDKDVDILLSTVDLELNHGFYTDKWYETGIFTNMNDDIGHMIYEERYETKEEAIANHNIILGLLKEGKYTIDKDENTYNIGFNLKDKTDKMVSIVSEQ